jgi:phosphatidylinositol-4,5-bisphosphate 3-kinase
MVTRTGNFFHIDFGHFLGNFKEKFGVKRERAPFVFTPDLAFVMGGKGSPMYQKFEETCCAVYSELRTHANKYISLFSLMLSTGLPELQSLDDLK